MKKDKQNDWKNETFFYFVAQIVKILLLMKMSGVKLTAIASLFAAVSAQAQVRVPFTNNDLRTNLEKVIADFPHHLSSVLGDTLVENPQTIEFTTVLDFRGALENSVTQYKSVRPIYSWQAVLLSSEDFAEAEQKYKWLYNQLKVMTVKTDGGYSFTFNGDYGTPDESRKFSSSVFKLTPNSLSMPKLKVEATMQFEFPEWKVSLLVYEKEREDNERGEIRETDEK